MPNLRQSIVEDFWQKKDARMYRILSWMESMEDWMLDDNEDVANSIFVLANTLERASRDNIIEYSHELIQAMAYMSSPRALRLMEWFDEHFPDGLSVEITNQALQMKDDEHSALLLDRFNTLNRLSLLGKMFSPGRTKKIINLLKQYSNDMN